jgi:hypothetical protein
MSPGDLITVIDLPLDREQFGGVEVYHICMDDIDDSENGTGSYSEHFLVPSGTPGIIIQIGMIEYQILFPQGFGWIDANWLQPV